MADLQPQIPQQIEDRFDDLLNPRGDLVGHQEQQIDIGGRRQLAPPIAADGDGADALRLGRVGGRVDALGGDVEGKPQQLVDQEGLGPDRRVALRASLLEPSANFRPPVLQRLFDGEKQRMANILGRCVFVERGIDRRPHRGDIDDRTRFQNGGHGSGGPFWCRLPPIGSTGAAVG